MVPQVWTVLLQWVNKPNSVNNVLSTYQEQGPVLGL